MSREELAAAVEVLWPAVAPLLAPAVERGELYTMEAVKARLLDGTAQLWPGERSAGVTELVSYPAGLVVRVWLAGGDLGELREMERQVIAWAWAKGAVAIEIIGRRGFAKALDGYREVAVMMRKDLAA